jgi:hypothetical protein
MRGITHVGLLRSSIVPGHWSDTLQNQLFLLYEDDILPFVLRSLNILYRHQTDRRNWKNIRRMSSLQSAIWIVEEFENVK